ncbi:hypothetical protein FI667_g3227, partial [Globisporangium splendens]
MSDWRRPTSVDDQAYRRYIPGEEAMVDGAHGENRRQRPPSQQQPVFVNDMDDGHTTPYRLHLDDLSASRGPTMDAFIPLNAAYPTPNINPTSNDTTAGSTGTIFFDRNRPSFVDQDVSPVMSLEEFKDELQPPPTAQEHASYFVPFQTPRDATQQPADHQRRTFEHTLPRTSLLVAREHGGGLSPADLDDGIGGRRTLDPAAYMNHCYPVQQQQPQRDRNSMKNLADFRPVSDPATALTTGTAPEAVRAPEGSDDERSRGGGSTASSSSRVPTEERRERETIVQRFASKQVRWYGSWQSDMWTYMKNAHPFIGIFGAHRRHPYKKRDRTVVLLAALVLDVPIAVVNERRLTAAVAVAQQHNAASPVSSRSLSAREIALSMHKCVPFHGDCSAADALCTQGSTCELTASRLYQCLPTVAVAPLCNPTMNNSGVTTMQTCPLGWSCVSKTGECAPTHEALCYVPRMPTSPVLSLAATDTTGDNDDTTGEEGDGGLTAIQAIFGILVIANNATMPSNSTTSNATSSTNGSAVDNSVQSVAVTLSKPSNGAVYSVLSTISIEWEVATLDGNGETPLLTSFTIEFSADGNSSTFSTIATNVTATSEELGTSIFHYDWHLNGEDDFTCTACVLRICATPNNSTTELCIRSDGNGKNATTSATAANSDAGRIKFYIVHEVLKCACGLSHAQFVPFSYLIALCIPFVVLVLEQLVTFYEDSKVCGFLARRGSPAAAKPSHVCLHYDGRRATKVGRVVVGIVLLVACVASGFQTAQVHWMIDQKGTIVLLWLAMYALCIVLGFIYSSVLHLAIFSMRWRLQA